MIRWGFNKQGRRGDLPLDQIRAVLFDLDGTLLGVDMQAFIPVYLEGLALRLSDLADGRRIADAMRQAVIGMLTEVDGKRTLEQRMLASLEQQLAIPPERYHAALENFCLESLSGLRPLVQGHPLTPSLLEACRGRGWPMVLATNPIFPRAVIEARLAWADIDHTVFDHVTDYESCRHCKPHPEYFDEILTRLDMPPDQCLMVGNDTHHDMAAGLVGMKTCLLTLWQIDRKGPRFPADWQGTHEELLRLLQSRARRELAEDLGGQMPFSAD